MPTYGASGSVVLINGVLTETTALVDSLGAMTTYVSGQQRVIAGIAPVTALNAVTATGASTAVDLGVVRTAFAMQTVVTGSPTGVTVNLEGSLDGSHWATIVSSTSTTGDYKSAGQASATAPCFRYIRANLTTLTAGTSPTVTAIIAAAA